MKNEFINYEDFWGQRGHNECRSFRGKHHYFLMEFMTWPCVLSIALLLHTHVVYDTGKGATISLVFSLPISLHSLLYSMSELQEHIFPILRRSLRWQSAAISEKRIFGPLCARSRGCNMFGLLGSSSLSLSLSDCLLLRRPPRSHRKAGGLCRRGPLHVHRRKRPWTGMDYGFSFTFNLHSKFCHQVDRICPPNLC